MKRLSLFIAVTLSCTLLAGPGQQALLTVKTPAGGGGAAWTDIIATGSTDTNINIPYVGEHWADITLTSGTATKLRLAIGEVNTASPLKLGLHNSAGALLASGTVSVTTTGYAEVTISSTAVTSGTYKISWVTDAGPGALKARYLNGAGTTYWNTSGVYNTLFDPTPTPDGTDTRTVAAGVYITP